MAKPKVKNPDEFILKNEADKDELAISTAHHLAQSTIGASSAKVMNFNGVIPNEGISLEYTKQLREELFHDIKNGDLTLIEEMLTSQAYALNMAFNSLAARATRQKDVSTTQMLMNLSLKAQNQSRATLDSLIALKQPNNTQFIKQTNITNGNQQVNNLIEKSQFSQNKLIKDINETLDSGGTAAPKRINSNMEALGEINRSSNSRRKAKSREKCR